MGRYIRRVASVVLSNQRASTSVRFLCILLFMCLSFPPATSLAQSADEYHPFLSDRFNLGIGVYFPSKDIKVRVDGSEPGDLIDLDDALKLDNDELVGSLTFRWRFGKQKKWSVWGQYWSLSDSDKAVLTEDLEWEDIVFKEGTYVAGGIDQEITRFFLGREFFTQQPNHEFGLGLGMHWMSLGAFIEGQILTSEGDLEFQRENVSADFPLPNIGAWYGYSWNPKWILQARLDWLSASVGDYKGGIWNSQVGIHWQTFKNIGFGLYYNSFLLNVDVDRENWSGKAETKQHGPWLAITATW